MNKPVNIYNYQVPRSGAEEKHFLLPGGRISVLALWLRLLLVAAVYIGCRLIYFTYALPRYEEKRVIGSDGRWHVYDSRFQITFSAFEHFYGWLLPALLAGFVLVQCVKRMHDMNRSGWHVLIPVYNLAVLFTPGTEGGNDYGVDPRPQKKVEYFDQLPAK